MKRTRKVLSIVLTGCLLASFAPALAAPANVPGIVGIETHGFVDTDGAKVEEIVVEYNVDLTGAEIGPDTYEVTNRGTETEPEVGDAATAGQVTGVSVNGKYVTLKLNTDYQLGSVATYNQAMYASVKQVKEIKTADAAIPAAAEPVANYTETMSTATMGPNAGKMIKTVNPGAYHIADVEQFQIYGETAYDMQVSGRAFHATHCWEEATGEYVDVDLPYALFVPEDYDASKEYALVLQIHDAGFMGNDPVITVTESQGSVNFASEKAQKLVQEKHGLGGVIVVAPQFEETIRTTRDNYSMSAGVPATWQLLDYLTGTYNISMSHIYGTGQSMGGMQVVAMAAQRDNYFAGIWANGCQWGSNHNLEAPYADRSGEAVYYEAPVDGTYITGTDWQGSPIDYRNWYYMISDDNILITNCMGDAFSTTVWSELKFLYRDMTGTEIPRASWNPLTDSKETQEATASQLLTQANPNFGFYWTAFSGGNHMATWIYSHGVWAHTEWLLSQTQESENARGKLDLDRPYALAKEQIQTEERAYGGGAGYFPTAASGSGTADYNSGLFGMQGSAVEGREPGWTYSPGASESAGTAATYTVVAGDCLWNIAQKVYGTGTKWNVIYEANRELIKNSGLIYVGQVLTIPAQ